MLIHHKISIDASPEKVWETTLDVENWPNWTPTVEHIRKVSDEALVLGSEVWIKQPGQAESLWIVTSLDYGSSFSWTSTRQGMEFTGSHQILKEGDQSINILTLEAHGWAVRLFGFLLKPLFSKALKDENEGLKKYLEARSEY